jgi:hypothetical protein
VKTRASRDAGSTLPLILGFFLVALMVVAGSVAASDAFVQQRGLQDVCDGAAAAAAAGAGDVDRGGGFASSSELRFADARELIARYLGRDHSRSDVHAVIDRSPDARTIALTCTQTTRIAFGSMFGKGDGVRHVVHSSAQAPLSG